MKVTLNELSASHIETLIKKNLLEVEKMLPSTKVTHLAVDNWCILTEVKTDCHGKGNVVGIRAHHIHSATCLSMWHNQYPLDEFIQWVKDENEIG